MGTQPSKLTLGFNAFSHAVQPQRLSEAQNGHSNRFITPIRSQAIHKTLVNFQFFERLAFEVGQGRVACTKVVDGNADARTMQDLKVVDDDRIVPQQSAFSDFYLNEA